MKKMLEMLQYFDYTNLMGEDEEIHSIGEVASLYEIKVRASNSWEEFLLKTEQWSSAYLPVERMTRYILECLGKILK